MGTKLNSTLTSLDMKTLNITLHRLLSFSCRPLPAITFDEFVMLTKAIELVLPKDSDIQKALDLFKRDFGMNWLVSWGSMVWVKAFYTKKH